MRQGLQIFRAAVDLKRSCHFSKIGITCQRGSGTALFFLQKFLRIVEDGHGFCRHFGRFFAAQLAEYVYDQGILNAKYSYSTAVGLFNTVVNIILLIIVNRIAKKAADVSFV